MYQKYLFLFYQIFCPHLQVMQEIPTEDELAAAVSENNINVNIHQPDAEHNKLPPDEDKQPISKTTSASSHSKNNSSASQSDSLPATRSDSSQTSEKQNDSKANNIQSSEQKEPKVNNLTTVKDSLTTVNDSGEKNVVLAKQNNVSAAASMTSSPTASHTENKDVITSTPQTSEDETKR